MSHVSGHSPGSLTPVTQPLPHLARAGQALMLGAHARHQ